MYEFHGLVKVKEHESKTVRYKKKKKNNRKRRKLRQPINIGQKVLIIPEPLKKIDPPGVLYKISTEKKNVFQQKQNF